jgi:hypothetical protein
VNLNPKHKGWVMWGASARVTALTGAACSDDDADDATAETVAETAGTSDGAFVEVESNPDDPSCDIERQIDSYFEAAFGELGPDATEDEQRAAVQTAAQGVVDAGIIEEALEVAPDVIRDDLDLPTSNVRAAAEGDVDVFFTPESDAAGTRVDAYCGLGD